MKFVHFQSSDSSESQAGILEGDAIRIVEGDIFGEWSHTGDAVSLADVKLRAPFAPRHIIGIGANYIAEGEPKPKPISDIPIFSLSQPRRLSALGRTSWYPMAPMRLSLNPRLRS